MYTSIFIFIISHINMSTKLLAQYTLTVLQIWSQALAPALSKYVVQLKIEITVTSKGYPCGNDIYYKYTKIHVD